jgi:uncharacterized membrane protein (UPF0127 family)
MYLHLTTLIARIALMTSILCVFSTATADQIKLGTVTFGTQEPIEIEIADTEELRAKGLMHRTQLAENQGMLFVYPDEALRGVWMKNTLLSLDVLFLSADGKIVSILHKLIPCTQEPCPIYTSTTDAGYMLEVNAGFVDRHQLTTGQDLIIEYRHDIPSINRLPAPNLAH